MNTIDSTFWQIIDDLDENKDKHEAHGGGRDVDPDPQRLDAERIASAAFCGVGLDPAVLSFATARAAQHWGLDEDEIDLRIAAAIVRTASRLATEFAS